MENQTIENKTPEVKETTDTINKEELFEMLDNVVAKRTEGITKNILKENGIESDEIKAFMEEYKTYKSGKTSSKEKELEELKIKNAELLKTIKSGERKSAISKVAKKLGISDEHLVYVEKLSDNSKFEKDGHFDEAEIESEFSKVLESIPGLKAQKEKEQEPGFVKIGGTKQETPNELLTENKLRRAFGLPEITK